MTERKGPYGFGKPAEAPDYEEIARIAERPPAAVPPARPAPRPDDPFARASAPSARAGVSPKSAAAVFVYAAVAASLWYGYASLAWTKIGRIPTEAANVAVLRQNLAKQQAELAALRGGSAVDSGALSQKETLLAAWLPADGPKLRITQADLIWRLAQRAGLEVAGLQKTEERRDKASVEKAGSGSAAPSPYARVWYVRYSLDAVGDEEAVLRFKEAVETHPALMIDSFSVVRSGGAIRYGAVVKAHYIVNQEG